MALASGVADKSIIIYIYIYVCVFVCVCVCLPWVMSVQISESPVQKNYAAYVFGVDHCLLTKKKEKPGNELWNIYDDSLT